MKYGVLVFSYKNFEKTKRQFETEGMYAINLGDYMQTLAVRRIYREMGIPDEDVLEIDRDAIAEYAGEPVILPLSACFYNWCFPLPENIFPVFMGFQAKEDVIENHQDYFRKFSFIGCRDTHTAGLFEKYGITATVTGCVTMTFRPREETPALAKVLVVYGTGAGAFPAEIFPYIPKKMLPCVELVYQRKVVHAHPLERTQIQEAELHARRLLEDYRRRATLVITPLHHVAVPCMAAGIPVILARKKRSIRFSYLETLMKVYGTADFPSIDWSGGLVDIDAIRQNWVEQFVRCIDMVKTDKSKQAQYTAI